jgi:hypothetical protein
MENCPARFRRETRSRRDPAARHFDAWKQTPTLLYLPPRRTDTLSVQESKCSKDLAGRHEPVLFHLLQALVKTLQLR